MEWKNIGGYKMYLYPVHVTTNRQMGVCFDITFTTVQIVRERSGHFHYLNPLALER